MNTQTKKRKTIYSPALINFRPTLTIEKQLNNLCKETQRTRSYFLRKALEEFLEEESLYRVALERWEDKNDPILTSKEFRAEIGL